MNSVSLKQISTEQELIEVLALCYNILGTGNGASYGYKVIFQMHDQNIYQKVL